MLAIAGCAIVAVRLSRHEFAVRVRLGTSWLDITYWSWILAPFLDFTLFNLLKCLACQVSANILSLIFAVLNSNNLTNYIVKLYFFFFFKEQYF